MGASVALAAGLTAAGGIGSALIGSNASSKAAAQQTAAEQQALDYTKQVQAPYLEAGNTSIAALMKALSSGQFGAGSIPAFQAPTAEQARNTPGYQFTSDQGNLAIERGAAASGGAFTGGTLKSLDQFNTGLADSTYSNRFNQALQGYQANLAGQQQQFQQAFAPVQLGANVASNASTNISQIMQNIGASQAAGTVGSANALTSGITGATNGISQAALLNLILGNGSPGGGSAGDAIANNTRTPPPYVGGGSYSPPPYVQVP